MKTLVIHPFDSTTRFLAEIYNDTDWTVIRNVETPMKTIKEEIKNHDRIVMLGHGTEQGLYAPNGRWLIDASMLYLLREKKELVAVWCNADMFFTKYNLKGKYTGMIVSDYDEAMQFGLYNATEKQIIHSNSLFAASIKYTIDMDGDFPKLTKDIYNTFDENSVIEFNRNNIHQTK